MTTNRHLINDFDIVRPTQFLDKGLPIPGLGGRFTVDEGWCAVVTEGGAFKELLSPGYHYLNTFKLFREVKATLVDTRLQTLSVRTNREFSIAQPVPVEIDLDIAIEYRVSDPRRVALEIKTPLTSFYDRIIQAVRGVVVHATIDEIRTQGEGIASATLQRLQGMQLQKLIGIEVLSVLVSRIKATDAGSDALAAQQFKEFTTVREWQLDSMITQQSRVSWEWLLMHRPEIAQQMLATHGELAREMIDKGLLDPAGFLNQAAGAPAQLNHGNLLGSFGFPGGMLGSSGGIGQPQLVQQAGPGTSTGNDVHTRMREEISFLEKQPGAKVDAKLGADGSYSVLMTMPRNSGGLITLYLSCPPGYPQVPPSTTVEVDEQEMPFQSAILRRWTGQYLVEIAREVKQYVG
ncbi:MAG: SPFH domain-containing protein [Chloroflexota bacterium]|nr:SPFH domain-containing protein [Chloroflexota bacterium]